MIRRCAIFSALLLLVLLLSVPHGLGIGNAIMQCANAATAPPKRAVNSITISSASGGAISNYPFQFGRPFLDGAIVGQPQVLINGQPVATQADVKNRYPDGSVAFAVIAVVIPAIPAGGSLTLTFQNQNAGNNTPLTQAQMLDPSYDFAAVMTLSPRSGPSQAASARTMLQNSDYKLWTSGPVAQTIVLGDDTTARRYDLGFGDGYHPFRPRYYATFWPATHQVFVRYVGENGLTTELEDLAYKLTLTAGNSIAYRADLTGTQTVNPKIHWTLTRWTREFWIGGALSAQVNINHNLAYLESTRFLPNFDASIVIPQSAIAVEYANWTNHPHDIYDGVWDGGLWESGMSAGGARQEIAPYPQWTAMWLYTGDWRMRQMALGMADLAASWPIHLRESDPTRRLSRADPPGLNPSTGLGHVVSTADRPTLILIRWLEFTYPNPSDRLTRVGPINTNPPAWSWDGAHQPSPFYPQYILTGDPWYLDEMYAWAGATQAYGDGSPSAGGFPQGRGPTGAYGGIVNELRGLAWVGRNRAETAFAAPDAAPEKAYFTYLMNDALARWEGGLNITGTVYDGTVEKNWGVVTGNPLSWYSSGADPCCNSKPPALQNWQSDCDPTSVPICADITVNEYPNTLNGGNVYVPGAVGSYMCPWMDWYFTYALGRESELGFAAKPLQEYTGAYPIGIINTTGHPDMISLYEVGVEPKGGGGWMTWPQVMASFWPDWFKGVGSYARSGLPSYFVKNIASDGRPVWLAPGLAMLVDQGAPGAMTAWAWLKANAYSKVPDFSSDPKWAIVPRTDSNVLPPQPTTTP